MKAHIAQLAGGSDNADHAYTGDHFAIVLDGATAFLPTDVDPGTYADALGDTIAHQLGNNPAADLAAVVRAGIAHTVDRLDLTPGHSPSSTVTILRTRDDMADLYVLGDSPIHYGGNTHTASLADDRLDHVAPSERHRYRARLRAGHGYDDQHRTAVAALQRAQQSVRNRPGGYWIAETDPDAADHALTRHVPAAAITWAVLATDGAADLIDHTGQPWSGIAHADADQLADLLDQLHQWETRTDPHGRALPRAKCHDDKTLVAVRVDP